MANEFLFNVTASYEDSEGTSFALQTTDFIQSLSTKKHAWLKMNVGTTEEAIILGEVTSLGYAIFLNRDTTNYIELRIATGSTKFATLKPALSATAPGFWIGFIGSGITAPYAIANSAACQMEYCIWSQ